MSPCEINRYGDTTVIVCSRGQRQQPRCSCGRASRYQCDAATGPGRTCDKYICGHCAVWARTKADTHYCAEHKGLA